MAKWLDSKGLKVVLGKSVLTAQRVIKTHAQAYPACVRKVVPKGKKSRPYFEILWDTDTNQPATQAVTSQGLDSTQTTQPNEDTYEPTRILRNQCADTAQGVGTGQDARLATQAEPLADGRLSVTVSNTGREYTQPSLGLDSIEYNRNTTHATVIKLPESNPVLSVVADDTQARYAHAVKSGKPIHLSCALLALAEQSALSGERQAGDEPQNAVQLEEIVASQGLDSSVTSQGLDSSTDAVRVSTNNHASTADIIALPARGLSEQASHALPEFATQIEQVQALIVRKNLHKTKQQQAAYKTWVLSRYFADLTIPEALATDWQRLKTNKEKSLFAIQHNLVGTIPDVLTLDNPLANTGRKCKLHEETELSQAMINRFVYLVMASADKAYPEYTTEKLRTVVNFHRQIQQEFNCTIEISKLYGIVKHKKLKHYLDRPDDDTGDIKKNSFYPHIPTGSLIFMDGVNTHHVEIRNPEGIFKRFVAIELQDAGSRMLLAMHCYFSESSANSVDVFTRFLKNNRFKTGDRLKPVEMVIRPDKAGGFENLARPINELADKYCYAHGFAMVHWSARAGTPKDKAGLESSHKAYHGFEHAIIQRFKDRIEGHYSKTDVKTSTKSRVTQLNITLDELNASGVIADYVHEMNSKKRQFQEDGHTTRFAPIDRWNAYLTGETFAFSSEDIDTLEIYGFDKIERTISKEGVITHDNQKWQVTNHELFSSHRSTPIKVSTLSNGGLALFKADANGVLIGKVDAPYQAPDAAKTKKMRNKLDEKVQKIVDDSEISPIGKALKAAGFVVNTSDNGNYQIITQLVKMGLTLEITQGLLNEKSARYQQTKPYARLTLFQFDAERLLKQPERVIPY